MGCAGAGNCQLARRRDCGDCKEISLSDCRLLSLAANGNDWYKWIKGLIRIYGEWMVQREGGQEDEEHDLGALITPAQASDSPSDNN